MINCLWVAAALSKRWWGRGVFIKEEDKCKLFLMRKIKLFLLIYERKKGRNTDMG